MLTINDMWWSLEAQRCEGEYRNCARFIMMLNSLPKKVAEAAYFPNREKAPWHVQFNFGSQGVVNVWPHKRRYQFDGQSSTTDDPYWTNLNTSLRVAAARHYAATGKHHAAE